MSKGHRALSLQICILACILCLPQALYGTETTEDAAGQSEKDRIRVMKGIAEPSFESNIGAPISGFVAEAIRDKESVGVKLSAKRNDNKNYFDILLKGPIGRNTSEAELVNLDGLGNSTRLGLTWNHAWWSREPAVLNADIERAVALCKKDASDRGVSFNPNKIDCDELYFKGQNAQQLRIEYEQIKWKGVKLRLFGGRARIGQSSFSFLDPDSLEKQKESKLARSLSAHLGWLWLRLENESGPRSDLLLFFGYRNEESYSPGENTELCRPFGDGGASRCDQVVLGAPTKKQKDIVFVELRRFFKGPIGISPRISYDLEDSVYGIELPIYFLQDSAGGLIGGVTAAWRSDRDDVTVGVTIGKRLDFSF